MMTFQPFLLSEQCLAVGLLPHGPALESPKTAPGATAADEEVAQFCRRHRLSTDHSNSTPHEKKGWEMRLENSTKILRVSPVWKKSLRKRISFWLGHVAHQQTSSCFSGMMP